MSIGDKIRQVRQDKNIKQESLAGYLKMGTGTLSKIENDKLDISANDLLKIAEYTDTPISKLLPDGVHNIQNNHDNANGVQNNYAEKTEMLEEWVKDLKQRNIELQEKIKRRDIKIESLKEQLSNFIK